MNYTEETVLTVQTNLENHLPHIGIDRVREEILAGLKSTQKYISPKFFYDAKGSELFEEITMLDEYYPTRTEKEILSKTINKLDLDYFNLSIIELGSGDASKVSILLNQLPTNTLASTKYFPFDISQSAIEKASSSINQKFPMVETNGIVADFVHQIDRVPKLSNRLFCFLGSTIGNFTKDEIEIFMHNIGREMKHGDSLLLGMDMTKNVEILEKAYNDSKGVTAKFNLNILNVINGLVNTNFDTKEFEHFAFYNSNKHRIEMHLKALSNIKIGPLDSSGSAIIIKKGETIHTENSHKFNANDITAIANWGGLSVEKTITDKNKWFSLVYFKK